MSLSDDIQHLRDRTLAALDAAHDYHSFTKSAWRFVRRSIGAGRRLRFHNQVTGSVISGKDLDAKSNEYAAEHLAEATFQQFLTIFERFLFDLLRLWLTAYPQSLGGKTLDFKSILAAGNLDAITQIVVGKELNELAYDRPAQWFAYLEGKVKLGRPTPGEIEQFAEAKASRDLLAHGDKVANPIYGSKAGRLARYRAGDKVEIPEPYHLQTWQLLHKLVGDIADAATARLP